jgi:hypothetical protein
MPDPRHRLREFSDAELRLIAGLTYDGALQARMSEEALIEIGRRIELDSEIDGRGLDVSRSEGGA